MKFTLKIDNNFKEQIIIKSTEKTERTIPLIKCPKCKSSISQLEESWRGIGQIYEIDEQGNVLNSFVPNGLSNELIYFATCSNVDCKNRWKLKGKKSIKEIEYWEEKASLLENGWKYMKEEHKLYK